MARLTLPGGETAVLAVEWLESNAEAETVGSQSELPLAVVPAALLARLGPARAGHIIFDETQNRFIPSQEENAYKDGRIYAPDIDQVPHVDEKLSKAGYLTGSEGDRVLEMQGHKTTLDLLFTVVLVSVFVFGAATVLAVFWDVTARKRSAIGIMRTMGMPPRGVVLIVFVRAAVVGLFGGVAALIFAFVISRVLTQFSDATCLMIWERDIPLTMGIAVLCSFVGVLYPAWYAARKISCLEGVYGGKRQ